MLAIELQGSAEVKGLDVKRLLLIKLLKRSERFVHLALVAAQEAMKDSRLCMEQEEICRIGVCVSSGIGGISIRDSFVHVTAGLQNEDEECDLDYTKSIHRRILTIRFRGCYLYLLYRLPDL